MVYTSMCIEIFVADLHWDFFIFWFIITSMCSQTHVSDNLYQIRV